ncbi:MAG TPA: peptidylprolyl isomerase [Terriglobales bacterium]|nr:peptidylprolyl isomerase [Terriglobales bacterium]
MRRQFILCVVVMLALVAGAQAPGAKLPDGIYAEVHTAKGIIVFQLRPDAAPMAVASFVGLAEGTVANKALDPGQPYFDHTTFHRVVAGHVIQTGIPHSTRARGPGYTFPNEIDARLSHNHAGAVNMANGGPGTNASQWCITLGDRSYLDGDFTLFGEVVQGLDVVMRIRQGDALDSVRILRIGKRAAAYHPTTASFQALVAAAQQRAAREAMRKQKAEAAWLRKNYPRAAGPAGGVLVQTLAQAPDGANEAATAGRTLHVRYHGQVVRYTGDWTHYSGPPIRVTEFVSGPHGIPGIGDATEFDYTVGTSKLNPGLDALLATLRAGDRRIVVVPATLGYGKNGLYPPETPGHSRFIINPNVLLVYNLEIVP